MITALQSHIDTVLPGDAQLAATQKIYNLMVQQAYVLTFADTFYLIALLFFGLLVFVPFIKKPVMEDQSIETHG